MLRLLGTALAAATLAAPASAYVTYEFAGYADKDEDRYFPRFKLYTADFVRDPNPSAWSSYVRFSAAEAVSSTNVATIEFWWENTMCCGFGRWSGINVIQRFESPGRARWSIGSAPFDKPASLSNGKGLWTVQQFDGPVPAFTPLIEPLDGYPGAWETPIGQLQQIDPSPLPPPSPPPVGVVPEPDVWAMLIAGFGWVGHALRRRRHSRRLIAA